MPSASSPFPSGPSSGEVGDAAADRAGPPYVVVGGGPAGARAAQALAERGHRVVVLGEEVDPPYDRTVLTKSALVTALAPTAAPGGAAPVGAESDDAGPGAPVPARLQLDLPALWPAEAPWRTLVEHRPGVRVVALDPRARTVTTADGVVQPFAACLLATGAEPRTLPGAATAAAPAHHHVLRSADDLRRLTADLTAAPSPARVRVVGGGVVGLEVAASLRSLRHEVEVVEAAPRILRRGVPEAVAAWLHDHHTSRGIRIRTGADGIPADDGPDPHVTIVGIGASPRTALAAAAGLTCDDGIVTDLSGRTSAPGVWAAGDCARWGGVRLESYAAAGEQGATAGAAMAGEDATWAVLPSSWSDQADAMLQSVGTSAPGDAEIVCRGDGFVLVLTWSPTSGRLTSAVGVSRGPAVARPVRAAQHLLAAGGRIDRDALTSAVSAVSAVSPVSAVSDVTTAADLRALASALIAAARDPR